MVTLQSDFVRGRLSLALYRQMGLDTADGLVATSARHYVDCVVRLGMDPAHHRAIAEKVAQAYPGMHQNRETAVEWASMLWQMHEMRMR